MDCFTLSSIVVCAKTPNDEKSKAINAMFVLEEHIAKYSGLNSFLQTASGIFCITVINRLCFAGTVQ